MQVWKLSHSSYVRAEENRVPDGKNPPQYPLPAINILNGQPYDATNMEQEQKNRADKAPSKSKDSSGSDTRPLAVGITKAPTISMKRVNRYVYSQLIDG
jgi:hypothetical protein